MLGRAEEEQERIEQEKAMAQAEAAYEMEGVEMQAPQRDEAEADDEGRDLDADVPDADAQVDAQDQSALDAGEENSGLREGESEVMAMDAIIESSAPAHHWARAAARGVSFTHQPSAFGTDPPRSEAAGRAPASYQQPQTPMAQDEEEAEMMMMANDNGVDLDADIPEAGSGLGTYEDDPDSEDEEGEWQHTDTDASLSSYDADVEPIIPPGRSRRIVSPSTNLGATPPPNTRTPDGSNRRSGELGPRWLRNATQRARESFSMSPPNLSAGNVGRSMRPMRRTRQSGRAESSSPMTPGDANASRAVSGGRLFSGRANPFQRHVSGNAAVSILSAGGEAIQSQGADSTAAAGNAGARTSTGSSRRRGLLRRES